MRPGDGVGFLALAPRQMAQELGSPAIPKPLPHTDQTGILLQEFQALKSPFTQQFTSNLIPFGL